METLAMIFNFGGCFFAICLPFKIMERECEVKFDQTDRWLRWYNMLWVVSFAMMLIGLGMMCYIDYTQDAMFQIIYRNG